MNTVLVLEPDVAMAVILQKYFETSYVVLLAHDSQSAIAAADKQKPDVVILELAIAEHNGIAFLHEFRSYNDWLKIPIVIYSHIPREDIGLSNSEWAKLGITSYLYKSTTTLATLSHDIELTLPNHEILA